jgi:hypothetical protein
MLFIVEAASIQSFVAPQTSALSTQLWQSGHLERTVWSTKSAAVQKTQLLVSEMMHFLLVEVRHRQVAAPKSTPFLQVSPLELTLAKKLLTKLQSLLFAVVVGTQFTLLLVSLLARQHSFSSRSQNPQSHL